MSAFVSNTRPRGERGTALIEFALVLPFLLLLTFMVIDFSRAFMAKNIVTQAAREGARVYAMPDVQADSARNVALRIAAVSGLTGADATPSEDVANHEVQVTVTAPFNWLYPGLIQWLGVSGTQSNLSFTCVMHKESS
jgi:Flp pilus assembly protein TadG